MKKNILLFLSLVAISSLSACHTGKTSETSSSESSITSVEPSTTTEPSTSSTSSSSSSSSSTSTTNPDPVTTDIVVNNVTSDEEFDGEAAYSNKLLLNHRYVSVAIDGTETIKGRPQALASNKNLGYKIANEAIATVDADGVVTGKAEGETTLEVTNLDHPEIKKTLPVRVYPEVTGRKCDSILKKLKAIDENNLKEIVDHELYEKRIYKNGKLQMHSIWDQNLVCSYDDAYFRLYETDGDTKTENGAMTFKDMEWVFFTNEYYDMYTFHTVGDVKTYYPVSMVAYMDEGKARYVPMFEVLDNLFTSGRGIFTNTFDNAKLEGFLDYALKDYNNVEKIYNGSFGEGTFMFDCKVEYDDSTADQDDESRYGIPYGTPTPSTYHLKFTVVDNQVIGYSNHGVMTYTIGNDEYEEVYDIDHAFERITDDNRERYIVHPDKTDYTLVDYLFAI